MEQMTEIGQACRHCKTPVVKKVPEKRSPKKAYWYEYYLYCPGCKRMYMLEAVKIINPKHQDPKWKKDWLKSKEIRSELDDGFTRNLQALEKIVNAPSGSPASSLRMIARRALEGADIMDKAG